MTMGACKFIWSRVNFVLRAARDVGGISADRLEVALFFPRLMVHSGGVERTLKVVEYAHRADLHFTAFVSSDVIRDDEVQRRLLSLERSGHLALQDLGTDLASLP